MVAAFRIKLFPLTFSQDDISFRVIHSIGKRIAVIDEINQLYNLRGGVIMKTVSICLNSIDKVKSFVNDVTKFDTDFDLVSGRYVIDAKSIMGIFSLDLSKPIELNVHAEQDVDEILETLKPYMA